MNFLAHLYLSGDDEGLIIGNFIGDEIKGNKWQLLDEDVARGVLMHRQIDHYTDTHPICQEVSHQIRPYFGKWAGVALDLCWDHFLAKSWNEHHSSKLKDFSTSTYSFLKENKGRLPDQSRHMLRYMSQYDWLFNYSRLEGMDSSYRGLSRRIGRENSLHRGAEMIVAEHDFLEQKFNEFFPELKRSSEDWKNLRKPL